MGERYQDDAEPIEEDAEEFDTKAEAVKYAKALAETMGAPEVTHTRRGLDSVTYETVEITQTTLDEDGDPEEYIPIDTISALTDEHRKRIDAHKRSYWDFLDYKSDSYEPLDF
jgi:hypothetical protein